MRPDARAALLLLVAAIAPAAAADASGWVTLDEARYDGGVARIRFTNEAPDPIRLPSLAPWWITDATGATTVYAPPEIHEWDVVAAGAHRDYAYDLRAQEGEPLPPGEYRAYVGAWIDGRDGPARWFTPHASFRVCAAPRVDPFHAADALASIAFCGVT